MAEPDRSHYNVRRRRKDAICMPVDSGKIQTVANVILMAFARQQWLRERAPLLRYTYISCLVPVDPKPNIWSHSGLRYVTLSTSACPFRIGDGLGVSPVVNWFTLQID
jgi:hypothetical protein